MILIILKLLFGTSYKIDKIINENHKTKITIWMVHREHILSYIFSHLIKYNALHT